MKRRKERQKEAINSKYRAAVMSVVSDVFEYFISENKYSCTYPWAQFSVPHLTCQHKFYAAFIFSNCGNPAKTSSRINPDEVHVHKHVL